MTTKEELIKNIKEWINQDDEIKDLQKRLKECKLEKKNLTDNLLEIMKSNEIDCFDINDGKLLLHTTKSKTALSKKMLIESLEKYFEKMPNVNTDDVSNFILDNREIKIRENIKRK
tara:strand:+ start:5066 stop:5413 length:348 start_codon:yes stop_codon:yes gene_type:complete